MSNVGQAALIVVGTVVGSYLGYPQLGFVLGSLAGSALFPTQLPPGPKITDNRTTTSAVGGPISLVFGTANVAGTVMWLAPYVQNSTEQGGKGGPEQQTFSYTQSIAIGLAERVDDEAADDVGAIGGLTRVWENGAIVYDIRPQQQANTFLGTVAETDQEYANRLTASAAYAETFVLYIGDELQEPDPTIEAIQGAGQVPPFRGLAYIVYPNRNLTIAQGLRHPNFQFEVYQAGTGNCAEATDYSNSVLYPWFNDGNIYTYKCYYTPGPIWGGGVGPNPEGLTYSTIGALNAATKAYTGVDQSTQIGYTVPVTGEGPDGGNLVPLAGSVRIGDTVDGVVVDPTTITLEYNFALPGNGLQETQPSPPSLYSIPGSQWWQQYSQTGAPGCITLVTGTAVGSEYPPDFPYQVSNRFDDSNWFELIGDVETTGTRAPAPPPPPCDGLPPSSIPGYSIDGSGRLVKCNSWVLDTSQNYKVLQVFHPSVGPSGKENFVAQYPLNPCLPITDPNYDNEAFWTAAYAAALASGEKIKAGLVYGTDYPVAQMSGYVLDSVICEGSGAGASIANIIAAVCKRSGLDATQIDVADMESITIDGYAVSSVCTGSSIITPLRSVGFFDAVETDAKIKFLARGKPVVATFTADDFGAYDGSSSASDASGASTCPPSISTTRSQDEDLPRSIRFHYIAVSRDYEDGEEDSPFRLATRAINDTDITVPLCLGDTQAAQCASVLWADAWAARNAQSLAIDQSWLCLDVGDCIGVPVDGVIQRLRIVSDTNASAVLRKLSCVTDDGGAYISFAVSTPPQRQPQRLNFVGATDYELLDLPCLQDSDSDPGFYVAAQLDGNGGMWKGATFYKSIDGGASFTNLFSLLSETVMATVNARVPASQAFTWDDTTEIVVNIANTRYTFESVSDDAVLAGANAAAMGADGRWEIVQFANATQVTPTQWSLSRLLRGRRGTEHVIGTSRAGDAFIMVSTGTIGRVVLQASEIGAARVYRGTSIGASFTSGVQGPFVGHGEALICFSPANPTATRITDDDVVIDWTRRSRLGRTLMSGVDIPLGEATEAFSIDILEAHSPASPEIVLRTLSSSTTSVLYSRSNQEADFGSPLPSSIRVSIYQLSAITGRGTPIHATLSLEITT